MSFLEHESGFRLNATRYECRCSDGKSFGQKTPCPAGCQRKDKLGRPIVSRGPMQFLIGTAEMFGLPAERHEELNQNPDLAVEIGAKFLGKLWREQDGNIRGIAKAYNGGDAYVPKAVTLYNKWVALIG